MTLEVALVIGLGRPVRGQRRELRDDGPVVDVAAAELVAATTIGMADALGMPVSTTHVLSSGVAGTMWANRSGIQPDTVRKIAAAWILTLPVAMALSGGLYWLATLFVG